MKVDVAIQSYKKPELLILTLMSLKLHSGTHVDTVYINDDGSDDEQLKLLINSTFINAMAPIKIRLRKNSQRMGWWYTPIKKVRPKYKKDFLMILKSIRYFFLAKNFGTDKENCRYQWAIECSDKEYIYIVHDDMIFYDDIVGLYLQHVLHGNSIVGDLGQCWRCPYSSVDCNPIKIVNGYRPSSDWPDCKENPKNRYPCRINEWSLLLSRTVALDIQKKEGILFGNYDNHGDVSAYWFAMLLKHGYRFTDPLPTKEKRRAYYLHADGGSGHSAWVDQGNGIKKYDKNIIHERLFRDFGLDFTSK